MNYNRLIALYLYSSIDYLLMQHRVTDFVNVFQLEKFLHYVSDTSSSPNVSDSLSKQFLSLHVPSSLMRRGTCFCKDIEICCMLSPFDMREICNHSILTHFKLISIPGGQTANTSLLALQQHRRIVSTGVKILGHTCCLSDGTFNQVHAMESGKIIYSGGIVMPMPH